MPPEDQIDALSLQWRQVSGTPQPAAAEMGDTALTVPRRASTLQS